MTDQYASFSPSRDSLGRKGSSITPNDNTDMDPFAKGVVVTDISGGTTLRILPVENQDGDWIDFVGVQVGFTPPYQVRRVGVATDCATAKVFD